MKTYLRKEARRHGSSLQITAEKVSNDMERLSRQIESMEQFICQTI